MRKRRKRRRRSLPVRRRLKTKLAEASFSEEYSLYVCIHLYTRCIKKYKYRLLHR